MLPVMMIVTLVVLGWPTPSCKGTSKITRTIVSKVENTPLLYGELYQDIRNFGKKSMRRKPNKILPSSEAYRVRIGKNKKMSSEEKEVIRKFETRQKQKIFEKNKKLTTEYLTNQDSECQK